MAVAPPPAHRTLPPAAAVLRRAMIGWGLGHLAIGDRRGWLLLLLQPLAIAGLALVTVQLIEGTRWLIVFPPLVALLVIWMAQAIHAHQRAVELGAERGGELQIILLLALAVSVMTAFWLLGGRFGSPTATLQAYTEAWMAGRADAASQLFTTPPAPDRLTADWADQTRVLQDGISRALAVYGPASGLDPQQPFASLRYRQLEGSEGAGRAGVLIEVVRSQRVETTVLGIIPTAGQETVVVEADWVVWLELRRQTVPEWLPFGRLDSYAWKISAVEPATGDL